MTSKKKPAKTPGQPQSLLQELAARPENLFTGKFRQQYAALCFRYKNDGASIEILVVTSRDSGRWIVPKGWPVGGKAPYESAEIEAWEEAGVRGKARKKPVGRYTYLKLLGDGHVVPCIVDIFQIEVKKEVVAFKERGERILAWVSPDEASRRVREVELKSLLVQFTPQGGRGGRKVA
ncbi:NUDIX hydrolase [Rhizobium sp. Root1220]|uniref:NUDIX hydrolase n=1 Tax=Rhizobium sp. Root1220 TaxID=1736432 RepID=UPI0006FC239E|nr:NUDIX hydrolase [Rhizobium sp. Root1220]KQV79623.1 DNA mismatch repair protein MutT [Rhizobium sp. Root1220]